MGVIVSGLFQPETDYTFISMGIWKEQGLIEKAKQMDQETQLFY